MGWWKSEHGIIGDHPADIMDKALDEIVRSYREYAGRSPAQGEIADLIEFCSCGILRPACGDPKAGFDPRDDSLPRASEGGNQGIFGPHSAPPTPGDMVNVDPRTGIHRECGEEADVVEEQIEERRRHGGTLHDEEAKE